MEKLARIFIPNKIGFAPLQAIFVSEVNSFF